MQPIAGVNVDTRKWWCCHFPDCIQPPSKKENVFKLSFGSRDLRPSNGDRAGLDSDFYNFWLLERAAFQLLGWEFESLPHQAHQIILKFNWRASSLNMWMRKRELKYKFAIEALSKSSDLCCKTIFGQNYNWSTSIAKKCHWPVHVFPGYEIFLRLKPSVLKIFQFWLICLSLL
jgi:hypothetical protein